MGRECGNHERYTNTIVGSPFGYTVTLTGGCGTITATGTITVINCSITLSSALGTDAQTVCNNTPIVSITYATTGATGASFAGLPAGVNGAWEPMWLPSVVHPQRRVRLIIQ